MHFLFGSKCSHLLLSREYEYVYYKYIYLCILCFLWKDATCSKSFFMNCLWNHCCLMFVFISDFIVMEIFHIWKNDYFMIMWTWIYGYFKSKRKDSTLSKTFVYSGVFFFYRTRMMLQEYIFRKIANFVLVYILKYVVGNFMLLLHITAIYGSSLVVKDGGLEKENIIYPYENHMIT